MARYTGKDLYAEWIYSGGTIVMTADYRTVTTNEGTDKVDITAGDDTHKSYKALLRDTTVSVELLGVTGSSGTTLWGALVPGTEGTLVWAPVGTATGNPKRSVAAFCEKRADAIKYNDVVSWTFDFQATEAITDATY